MADAGMGSKPIPDSDECYARGNDHQGRMVMKGWDIIRNGKIVDTVFYIKSMTLHEVRDSLIRHDGFPVDIIVRSAV